MAADANAAFDAMYAAHRQTLHAFLLGRTGDAELALDLLQDVFIRAWRNLDLLAGFPPERQRAWLVAACRNLSIDHFRAQATRRATSEALGRQVALAEPGAPADLQAMQAERLEQLDSAIRRLPEDSRVVLVLHLVDNRNSTEIGELLGRPPGTVRYQLAEARRRLARDLGLQP